MSEQYAILEPQDARDYLDAFDGLTRIKGEAYFRQQRVESLTCLEPGRHYSAAVRGSRGYVVALHFDESEGWQGNCSCPMAADCKHVYAAMKFLLAEASVASVRDLSAGRQPRVTKVGFTRKPDPLEDSPLAKALIAALRRPLNPQEAAYVRKVREVYTRCSTSRRFSHWDFRDLGFQPPGNAWDLMRIWPVFPPDDHRFWLCVANAAQEQGLPLPACLEPVTDLDPIREQYARFRRQEEVNRWKQVLGNLSNATAAIVGDRGSFDLRLALLPEMAALQWLRPGQQDFEPIKDRQFRQLATDLTCGRLALMPEAELLWEAVAERTLYGRGPELRYPAHDGLDTLARVLRLRSLHSRVVNAEGQPMLRAANPLRWALQPAEGEHDDYRLRLVQADGAPLPPLWCTLEGHPPLYVTRDVIFTGPPTFEQTLRADQENRIPAPAIECRAGVQFLDSLRVELPPRIQERIRRVPLQVRIHCELKPSYPGSPTECCYVHVSAESADGQVQEAWTGASWRSTKRDSGRKRADGGNGAITLYDRSLAQDVPRLLEPLGLKNDTYSGGQYVRVTKKFPALFVPWLQSLPPGVQVQLAGDLASLAQNAVSGRVRLDVTEAGIDWFDLSVVLDVADTTLTPAELKLLLNAKGGFVRLKDKGWRRLQFDLDQEDDERLARLGLTPHELTAEPQRMHALQLADDAAKRFLPEPQVEQIQRRASEIKARVTPDVPAAVTAALRPYQRDGFHFLAYLAANRFGGILADDMGLGKTLQTLAWLVWLRASPPGADQADLAAQPPQPTLVVCPKSVMDNWQAEAARFTPGLRVKRWPASELDTLLQRLGEADVHVLNYSQLRIVGESLLPVPWLAVILDEGQYIKNPSSQTAQIARALRADHRLVLTGTPIENRLLDLWSLMAFVMPGVLGSRHQFAKIFDAKEDPFARRRLAARVRPFLLRRTKTQVAKDLPDRIEEDLYCEMDGEQKTLYRAELKRAQQMLLRVTTQKQLAQERFHFLTSLLRLRQICCHPALVTGKPKAASAKLEALLEQLEPLLEEGHKVLVFSQFVEMLALLQDAVTERQWPHFYLAGDTENRGELIARFQAAEGAAVFLISLKAGGFGLNLTAASYVVLFDPWWNPAVENQAIDRTHRIGQVNKVIAYRLLIKDSIEEKIRALQKQKKALAEDVLGEEKFAQSLTLEDLHYLFAD
jgi:hypothetical protein